MGSFLRSVLDLIKFLRVKEDWKDIIFFSEGINYFSVFENIVKYLIKNKKVIYITADKNDKIYNLKDKNLKIFYSKNIYTHILFLNFIRCKNLIMTMPDLDNFEIKKSKKVKKYIYLFHSLVSCHMIYQNKAFHNFDLIHCSTQNQYDELKELKNYYKSKYDLSKLGYPKLDSISKFYDSKNIIKNTVIIAPSWGKKNILNSCLDELIVTLIKNNYKVILRPHNQFFKTKKNIIKKLNNLYGYKNLVIEKNNSDFKKLLNAEFLITDWSGISMEYSFITNRPVLFINTPKKINNKKFNEININPIEIEIRNQIGMQINLDQISLIPKIFNEFKKKDFSKDIDLIKKKYLINNKKQIEEFNKSLF
tara:strand:+ start:1084 stop:2175 length:1092 start_codon:yes stop_codon:yes gene_type:complete